MSIPLDRYKVQVGQKIINFKCKPYFIIFRTKMLIKKKKEREQELFLGTFDKVTQTQIYMWIIYGL